MSLSSKLAFASLKAEEKPWKGRLITSPNGNVFRWTKDTPPTSGDMSLMMATDRELSPLTKPMFEDAQKRGIKLSPENRLAMQKAALSNRKTQQYQAAHPDIGTLGPLPGGVARFNQTAQADPLTQDIANDPNSKFQGLAQRKLASRERSLSPGQRAIKGAEEATQAIAGPLAKAISPITGAATMGLYGPNGGQFGITAPSQLAAGILTMPIHAAAEVVQLGDPSVSLRDKAGAAANLIMMTVPVEELAIGGLSKGLGKVLLKVQAKNREAFQAIERALNTGQITESALKQAVEVKVREMPKIGAPTKETGYRPSEYKPKYPGIDVTNEVANRKALPAPEIPTLRPTPEDAFVHQNWRERTEGLLNAVRTEMANTKGAGRKYGPLARDLERSLAEGKPHPGIDQELRDIYQRQNPPEPPSVETVSKKPTRRAKATGEANAGIKEKPQGATQSVLGQEGPQVELPQAGKGTGGPGPKIQTENKTGAINEEAVLGQGRTQTPREEGIQGQGKTGAQEKGQVASLQFNGGAETFRVKTEGSPDYVTGPEGVSQKTSAKTSNPRSEFKFDLPGDNPSGQGITHADIGKLREDIGWESRGKSKKPDADLINGAKKYAGKEETIAERLLGNKRATLTDEESLALGNRLNQLKEEMASAKAANDSGRYDLANDAAYKIADALDESGSRQGRAFRARQFLAKDSYDAWSFERNVKKANFDTPLQPETDAKMQSHIDRLTQTNETLKKERDDAVAAYNALKNKPASSPARGPRSPSQRRSAALASLKRLGVPVAEFDRGASAAGGMRSRRSGAINIPQGSEEQIARNIRSLVRSYADEGLDTWEKVLSRLQRDLPGIEEEQALYILSGKYKTAKLEADIAKREADAFMRNVRQEAEHRLKPAAIKILNAGGDLLNTTQRTAQTTLDNSMALIQAKNVLTWKPGTWFKGVGNSLRAFVTKDPIGFARKISAEIANHPLYKRAVEAKLALSDIDGAFNKQEEFFAGKLENVVPGLSHSKAAATVMMNKIRFDLFRKLAAAGPDTPEYLADIARQINIATGKGTGRLAEKLGSREAGFVSYAPRYYLSKWQHNLGAPLILAKSGAGRAQAIKMYGTQLAFYGGLIKAAQLFGFDVDLDPRSTNFGVANGKDYSFDLFKQQSEGIRTLAQLIWGRTSRKGEYKAPGEYGAYGIGDYIESKLSPIGRSANMLRTGKTYDDVAGVYRDATPSDFWKSYIPMSATEIYKNREAPYTAPLSFLGGNVDLPIKKNEKPNSPTPSISLMKPTTLIPPGLKSILGQK